MGACKWSEIIKIKENFLNIIPMHCVSSYPLEAEMANFPKMQEIKKLFGNFGYSGHYSGIEDAIIAIVNGASYIEKHFTIDKNLLGRDNKFALLPEEFKKISEAYEILTNKDKYFNKRNLNGNSAINPNHIFQELFKNMHINSQNFSTNININNSISRVSQVSIVNGQRVEIISETINGVTRQRKIITPLKSA